MSVAAIPKEQFESRVQKVAKQWPWPSADALLVVYSSNPRSTPEAKVAEQLHMWFFNVEFPDLIFLLQRSGQVTVWASQKKMAYFEKMGLPWLTRVVCDKKFPQEDQQKFLQLLRGLPKQGEQLVLAVPSEKHFGPVAEEATKQIESADFVKTLDATLGIGELCATKDDIEVQNTKKASLFGCLYMQEVIVSKWMDALDAELTTSPQAIVTELQELLDREAGIRELCRKLSIESSEIEVSNHLVQSGRHIELFFGAAPSQSQLAMNGTFVLGVVLSYASYHAAITRTYIVNPTTAKKKDYLFVREMLKRLTGALKPGVRCKDVHAAAKDFLNKERPDLIERFGEHFGFMTGISLQEKAWTLSASCDKEVPANSTFVVSVSLKPHPTDEDSPAIWLTETVFVPDVGKAEIFTAQCSSLPSDCFYELEDEEAPAAPPASAAPPAAPVKAPAARVSPERKRSRSRERPGTSKAAAKAKSAANNNQAPKAKAKAKAKAAGGAKAPAKPKDTGQASMTSFTRPAKPKEEAPAPRAPEPWRPEPRTAAPKRKPPPPPPPSPKRTSKAASRAETRQSSSRQTSASAPAAGVTMGRATRETTQRSREVFAEQVQLEEEQQRRRAEKLQELQKRFKKYGIDGFGGPMANGKRGLAECQAYSDPAAMPKAAGPPKLRIDMEKEALLVPYCGSFLVFHVRMIKNMTRDQHDGVNFFRVNFLHPGQGKSAEDYPQLADETVFYKELCLKSPDTEMFDACYADFKEVSKRIKDGTAKAQHRHEAQQAKDAPLRELRGCPVIRDISIKPSLSSGRANLGNLEGHLNGLRFSVRGSIEKLEIPYANIKTAIYQPAEKGSLVVYIHIHLKPNMPVMMRGKPTSHIQFYTEVRPQVEDLSKRRSANAHDPDEVMEEQREEELKERINQAFKDFSSNLQKIKDFPVKFEVAQEGPFQFTGVPQKQNVRVFCCSNCLVAIEEWPPLVVDMSEVELVVFERALLTTREFDLVLVLKNYTQEVIRITMIPTQCMQLLKAWLHDLSLVWYTIGANMHWPVVMKDILADLPGFIEDGGWQHWFTGSDDEMDAAAKDDDESDWEEPDDDDDDAAGDIEEDSSDEPEVEEDEDEDEDDGEDEDEDEDYDGDDDDEDSGKDWSELEREAEEEDRKATRRGGKQGASKAAAKARPGRR